MVFTLLEYLNTVFACFISSIILLSYLFIDIINLLDSKKLHIFITFLANPYFSPFQCAILWA